MADWYAQTNYNVIQGINGRYTIAAIGCFNTSFCNLMKRFGKDINPVQFNDTFKARNLWIDADDGIRDDLAWESITALDGQVVVTGRGNGGWPNTNNAIVKFHYQSISQPWKAVNGQRVANMIDHFCLVADENQHLIIDSWDGKVKAPGQYGEPVGWATYANIVPQPVNTPLPTPNINPATTYTFAKGDTVWEVARKKGYTAAELMSFNGITDPRTIPIGYVLRLPVNSTAPVAAPVDTIKYQALPEIRKCHIKKPGGTEKWAFGNVRSWSDFVSISHVAENTNLDLVGVATVEVQGDTAAYYMDAQAFGDYKNTGKVNNPIGYSHADLEDGYYTEPVPTPAPEPEHPVQVTPPAPEPIVEPQPAPAAPAQPLPVAYSAPVPQDPKWKDTYHDFEDGPVVMLARNFQVVPDYGRGRPDKHLEADQPLEYAGTFTYNGQLLWRPSVAKAMDVYFGVPRTNLGTEDEVLYPELNQEKTSKQKQLLLTISATIKRITLELPGLIAKIKQAKAK